MIRIISNKFKKNLLKVKFVLKKVFFPTYNERVYYIDQYYWYDIFLVSLENNLHFFILLKQTQLKGNLYQKEIVNDRETVYNS